VKKLIAGVSAFICDQCVALCSKVVDGGGPLPGVAAGPEATKKSGSGRAKAGWSGYDPAPRDAS
jgi:ClpX C4-type zinc finger